MLQTIVIIVVTMGFGDDQLYGGGGGRCLYVHVPS